MVPQITVLACGNQFPVPDDDGSDRNLARVLRRSCFVESALHPEFVGQEHSGIGNRQ
jgi:hypothetical protein